LESASDIFFFEKKDWPERRRTKVTTDLCVVSLMCARKMWLDESNHHSTGTLAHPSMLILGALIREERSLLVAWAGSDWSQRMAVPYPPRQSGARKREIDEPEVGPSTLNRWPGTNKTKPEIK